MDTWYIMDHFCKGDNFFDFFLLSCTYTPFWKGVYSKRKEFAPKGSKFFPFRVEPFSEGRKTMWIELPPLKMY